MSFLVGQRVVCINDQFPAIHRQALAQLPVKGRVYTVRSVYLGRSQLIPSSPGASDGAVGIRLVELRNPDPERRWSTTGDEPGFSSERFAPFDNEADEIEQGESSHAIQSIVARQ